ncbi:hypothetical protein [Fontibacter flavus]|uniref:Uncharacterized protein n=1 Tax=Fontibacter flavus TaxID=654838 RepID=A0ABV6FWY1_9BACT
MDFDQLENIWKKADNLATRDSEAALHQKLMAVTGTQRKITKYFRFEMIVMVSSLIFFGAVAVLNGGLEPYFYKLLVLVLIGSIPINVRLFLSMERISRIDYSYDLQKNLIKARNHLKITIRVYYTLVVFSALSLAIMSWLDSYFLDLPFAWQIGVMVYLFIYLITSLYLVNKLYGRRLKELEKLVED